MHNQNKIYRVLQLIYLLQDQSKSIVQISEALEATERTVYRYLDLLRELGYQIRKDLSGKYYIQHPDKCFFSSEELSFLIQLLQNSSKKSILARSILKKIKVRFADQELELEEVQFRSGQNLVMAMEAIQKKQQVELINYHSANSETISNRWVEPIRFTPDLQCLAAYEILTQKTKYFHLNRMDAIRLVPKSIQFESHHRFVSPDIFGFNETGMELEIDLVLSFKSQLWMKEAYPACIPHLKELQKGKFYRLTTTIHDERPLRRLMEGLPEDIFWFSEWNGRKK